ncbi:hypothetical protein [Nonomuraea sp. NPDC050643]|uniref:hypothetical protein n=1 Tax=Nonomuraea sp. NPDC050643 TaxID=3155660 RepID=UPI003410F657
MRLNIKKVITYVGVGFVVFFLFTRPAKAADAVNGIFDGILQGADQLAIFATRLL